MNMIWAPPEIDETRCRRCELCVQVCPFHAVQLGANGPQFSCPEACASSGVHAELGIYCLCEEACPSGAISWPFEIVIENNESR
jgi:ferredoxin